MVTDKSLPLTAILGNIEVEGDVENGKRRIRSMYSVRLYVADKEVVKSTHPVPRSSVFKWEWNADNQIRFLPSSMIKVVIYRGFSNINLFNDIVVQYEGRVEDLLDNSERQFCFDG